MKDKTVQLKIGPVTLVEPLAGVRNEAMEKAYSPKTGLNEIRFMMELLPKCVRSHPFGTMPINQALDKLHFKEYDQLVDELKSLMEGEEEVEKKSEGHSDSSVKAKENTPSK